MQKKYKLLIIFISLTLLLLIGTSFAFWIVTKTQTNYNELVAGCVRISLSVDDNNINLDDQYPMTDEEGMALTPLTFTIKNNCNDATAYLVSLESIGDSSSTIPPEYIKVSFDGGEPKLLSQYEENEPSYPGAFSSRALYYGVTSTQGSDEHTISLWIDFSIPVSETGKSFSSKISITAGGEIEPPVVEGGAFAHLIMSSFGYDDVTNIPEVASTTGIPNEAAIYKTTDDQGDGVFLRGNITNNYVKFGTWQESNPLLGVSAGDPMYWRVIRINGDQSVRMIYDGTTPLANGSTKKSYVAEAAYSNFPGTDYAGYYTPSGGENNISTILNTWYENNIKGTVDSYITDQIFCSEQEMTDSMFYKGYTRVVETKSPALTCSQNSQFTVSSLGNGLLKYPIGLITSDEVNFIGSVTSGKSNKNFYLYDGNSEWTATPSYTRWGILYMIYMDEFGCIITNQDSTVPLKVRPVINLRSDVTVTGTGTISDPYIVS